MWINALSRDANTAEIMAENATDIKRRIYALVAGSAQCNIAMAVAHADEKRNTRTHTASIFL